jgi:hypothetical protein
MKGAGLSDEIRGRVYIAGSKNKTIEASVLRFKVMMRAERNTDTARTGAVENPEDASSAKQQGVRTKMFR